MKSLPLVRVILRELQRSDLSLLDAAAGPGPPGHDDDIARLKRLPAQEMHLALVKEHYSNVRANIWFDGLDRRNRGRMMVSAELPLLYPLGRSKSLPDILNTPRPFIGKPSLARPRHSPNVSPRTGAVRPPDYPL